MIVTLGVFFMTCHVNAATSGDIDWNLYPNPFDNHISVEWNQSEEGKVHLLLFDSSGKLVSEQEVKARVGQNVYIVEFEDLPSGIYTFYFHDERKSKMYHGKVVKN